MNQQRVSACGSWVNGQRQFDFVVTKTGQLILGSKHHFLGNAEDVLAAGQLRLNGQGQIRAIDNLSGHYRPSASDAAKFPGILKAAGLNVQGATLESYKFTINQNGFVINRNLYSRTVIK